LKKIRDIVNHVFSDIDWASYYSHVQKLDSQVEDILQSPCPFYSGKRVFETHFAFQGMPMINGVPLTVAKWLELHPSTGMDQPMFYFKINPLHAGQPHTDVATLEPRLYIMLREIVPCSTGKMPEELEAMLPPEYEIPSTIAEVTKNILVFRKTGKRSNQNYWALCKERTVKTSQVFAGHISCVGDFTYGGLEVNYWNVHPNFKVGVGASRILNFTPRRLFE